eukprot:6923828-Karenia_brevis.AAC.1
MATKHLCGLRRSGDFEDLSKDSPVEISSDEDVALTRVRRMRKDAAENETSDEDEDGERRVKRGEKDGGTGGCLMVIGCGKRKPSHDGCGLSSPGRWQPSRRISRGGALVTRLRDKLLCQLSESIDVKCT